jgi:hypothetical protein
MSREQLVALYLVWRNDFLTVGGFAERLNSTRLAAPARAGGAGRALARH